MLWHGSVNTQLKDGQSIQNEVLLLGRKVLPVPWKPLMSIFLLPCPAPHYSFAPPSLCHGSAYVTFQLVGSSSVAVWLSRSPNSKFHSNSHSQAHLNHSSKLCSLTSCTRLSFSLLDYFSQLQTQHKPSAGLCLWLTICFHSSKYKSIRAKSPTFLGRKNLKCSASLTAMSHAHTHSRSKLYPPSFRTAALMHQALRTQ